MNRSIFPGMTDYSNKPFENILHDLKEDNDSIRKYKGIIEKDINKLEKSKYWSSIPTGYIKKIKEASDFFDSCISEITNILVDIRRKVEQHHINRLKQIGDKAHEINTDLVTYWSREYPIEDPNNEDFKIVYSIYINVRELTASLEDISNMAYRLNYFIGRRKPQPKPKQVIGFVSLLISVLVLMFGDNLYDKFDRNKKSKLSNIAISNAKTKLTKYSIDSIERPYLASQPIFDSGLYLKHYFNDLEIGGQISILFQLMRVQLLEKP